jgi:hypothetical protein
MYTISLYINGSTLLMDYEHGYLINTITGLTGLSGRLNTVQNAVSIGEAYVAGTVGGLTLTVTGMILDANKTAKQNLLDEVVPLGTGKLTIYRSASEGVRRPSAYRTIDVVVQTTPTITQEKHAKFSFQLYAPYPVWKAQTPSAIAFTANGTSNSITVAGQADAEFSLDLSPAAGTPITTAAFIMDAGTANAKYLQFDFTKYNASGTTETVTVRVGNGAMVATLAVAGTNITYCIDPHSTLLTLPAGSHTIMATAAGNPVARFAYYPSYVGVIV